MERDGDPAVGLIGDPVHAVSVWSRSVREDASEMLDTRRLQDEELKLTESPGVVGTCAERGHLGRRRVREADESEAGVAAEGMLRLGDREAMSPAAPRDERR